MRITRVFLWIFIGMAALLLMAPPAYSESDSAQKGTFKQEELDQMLAPVALYPDALLAQLFMAATYPLEVVEADRWAKGNKGLKGDALNAKLDKQTWDQSVKALVSFPDVLAMMSEKLDWTQKVGDAFLAQQKQVMDTVQKLRSKAYAQGKLTTTTQQKVVVKEQVIEIVPSSPTVVYVPAYDPAVVYGPWWYPAYPPYPVYPPGAMMATSMVSFGLGVAVGAAWSSGWGSCNWHTGDVNVNVNKNVNVNNTNIHNTNVQTNKWQHDPDHRKGVAYRDNGSAQKYGQTPRGNADARQNYRGFDDKSGQTRPSSNQKGPNSGAGSAKTGSQASYGQKNAGKGAGMDSRQPSRQTSQPSAFEGVDHGAQKTAMNSERGRTSRESMSASRGSSSWGGTGRSGASGFGGHRR
ncbi:MAG TPA: DUF3300 domain-containing protein [Syntrophorhabdaceae bacterium]